MSTQARQLRHMTPSSLTFLESLTPAERDALLSAGRLRRWGVGEVLFREGDAAGSAIVIVSGLVKIHKRGSGGDELILSLCGPGDLLGEVAAVQGATRSAEAVALQEVEAAAVVVADLRALLAQHPRLTLVLLELALGRLRLADERRLEFATAESLPRVTSRLLELAERFGVAGADGKLAVDMPISQEELASWAAASRESTLRALRTLRELGLIETRRKRLVILDADGLRRHAASL
jgi:CRP/FNR family cyclic AMP-dependent transcriptional regulator